MKQASITCKHLYENPQYFEITSKLSSAVKAPTEDSNTYVKQFKLLKPFLVHLGRSSKHRF
jgi:hypothetical protein